MKSIENLILYAQLQDSLLQSYRQLTLTFQTILLAIGIYLLSQILEADKELIIISFEIIFVVLFLLAIMTIHKMQKVIIARGVDVSYWHKQILTLEQNYNSEERYFTLFKKYQKEKRVGTDYLSELVGELKKLDESQIDQLLGKGLGHTRKILDNYLLKGLISLWVLIFVISLISFAQNVIFPI